MLPPSRHRICLLQTLWLVHHSPGPAQGCNRTGSRLAILVRNIGSSSFRDSSRIFRDIQTILKHMPYVHPESFLRREGPQVFRIQAFGAHSWLSQRWDVEGNLQGLWQTCQCSTVVPPDRPRERRYTPAEYLCQPLLLDRLRVKTYRRCEKAAVAYCRDSRSSVPSGILAQGVVCEWNTRWTGVFGTKPYSLWPFPSWDRGSGCAKNLHSFVPDFRHSTSTMDDISSDGGTVS